MTESAVSKSELRKTSYLHNSLLFKWLTMWMRLLKTKDWQGNERVTRLLEFYQSYHDICLVYV